MPRHKHADAIIAWANGEEIEFRTMDSADWLPMNSEHPTFNEHFKYRIKPKTVKREGWVNVFSDNGNGVPWAGVTIYSTKEEADQIEYGKRVACIRIEWEEEV